LLNVFVRAKNSTTNLLKQLLKQMREQNLRAKIAPKSSHILYAKSVEKFQELPSTEVTKIMSHCFLFDFDFWFWGIWGDFAPVFKPFILFYYS
tara:strand:- start:46 stop:324 length:279 start_codon:yes stop_codon:yes gene_type:complete